MKFAYHNISILPPYIHTHTKLDDSIRLLTALNYILKKKFRFDLDQLKQILIIIIRFPERTHIVSSNAFTVLEKERKNNNNEPDYMFKIKTKWKCQSI